MYLLDDDGEIIEAECSFDQFEGTPCVVVESSGGANIARGVKRRNPDYNKLLSVLFRRLANCGVRINRVALDSSRVAKLPIEERIAKLPIDYPIDLASVNVDEFRKLLQREIAQMHRDPSARKGGNAQKRIRILTDKRIDSQQLVSGHDKLRVTDSDKVYAPGLTETERSYLRSARIGQGQFRKNLLTNFKGVCPVTGIKDERLLVASHIKPWKICTNAERLDAHNGILFSALADQLFDQGLVTFADNGEVMSSPSLSASDRINSGIDNWGKLKLSERSKRYMEYHRAVEFQSTQLIAADV